MMEALGWTKMDVQDPRTCTLCLGLDAVSTGNV